MIKKKGFTHWKSVSIVLGIGTLIAFMKFQDMRNNQKRYWLIMSEHRLNEAGSG